MFRRTQMTETMSQDLMDALPIMAAAIFRSCGWTISTRRHAAMLRWWKSTYVGGA